LAELNRALFDAHADSDVVRTSTPPSAGAQVEKFDDISRKLRDSLMSLGTKGEPRDLIGKSWDEIAEGSAVVRAIINTIPPDCLADDPALGRYLVDDENLDQKRIAARDRMLVEAVRGVAMLEIAAKACSAVALSHKGRRGPRPNPLPPAILDNLVNLFSKMFDRPPTVRRDVGTERLGGPTYDWVQEVLVIARDRLEPEKMRETEIKAVPLPPPPWSNPISSVEQPSGFKQRRHRSPVEEAILSAIKRLLGSGAMAEDLQHAVRRWKNRTRVSVR
jgi:hypothetical protein